VLVESHFSRVHFGGGGSTWAVGHDFGSAHRKLSASSKFNIHIHIPGTTMAHANASRKVLFGVCGHARNYLEPKRPVLL
jgi:hypothetical protein